MLKFQKILLLICISAALIYSKKKKKAEIVEDEEDDIFENYDISSNMAFPDFDEEMKNLRQLSFIYVFDSLIDKSMQMTE